MNNIPINVLRNALAEYESTRELTFPVYFRSDVSGVLNSHVVTHPRILPLDAAIERANEPITTDNVRKLIGELFGCKVYADKSLLPNHWCLEKP